MNKIVKELEKEILEINRLEKEINDLSEDRKNVEIVFDKCKLFFETIDMKKSNSTFSNSMIHNITVKLEILAAEPEKFVLQNLYKYPEIEKYIEKNDEIKKQLIFIKKKYENSNVIPETIIQEKVSEEIVSTSKTEPQTNELTPIENPKKTELTPKVDEKEKKESTPKEDPQKKESIHKVDEKEKKKESTFKENPLNPLSTSEVDPHAIELTSKIDKKGKKKILPFEVDPHATESTSKLGKEKEKKESTSELDPQTRKQGTNNGISSNVLLQFTCFRRNYRYGCRCTNL